MSPMFALVTVFFDSFGSLHTFIDDEGGHDAMHLELASLEQAGTLPRWHWSCN
jgi:hypothetical protein